LPFRFLLDSVHLVQGVAGMEPVYSAVSPVYSPFSQVVRQLYARNAVHIDQRGSTNDYWSERGSALHDSTAAAHCGMLKDNVG
jgi:hypothetical protein